MLWLILILFSASIGSFLNVVFYRYPKILYRNYKKYCFNFLGKKEYKYSFKNQKLSLLLPKSFCPKCKKTLKFYHNIPIISYIFLKGKCYFCGKKISFHYFFIEFLCIFLAIVFALKIGFNINLILYLIIIYTLIAISLIDFKTFFIVDELCYFVLWFSLFLNAKFETFINLSFSIYSVIIIFFILEFIRLSFYFIKKKEGFGKGDTKLICAISSFTGILSINYIIFFASILGIIFTVFYKKRRIPFAPFIVISTIFILYYKI